MKQQIPSEIVLDNTVVRLLDEGLVLNEINIGANIETEDILQIKRANEQLTGGQKYVVLIKSGEFSSISKEARQLTASEAFVQNTLAKAILVQSIGQKLVGQFYLSVNRPAIKTKLFKDEQEAIDWLYLQLKQGRS